MGGIYVCGLERSSPQSLSSSYQETETSLEGGHARQREEEVQSIEAAKSSYVLGTIVVQGSDGTCEEAGDEAGKLVFTEQSTVSSASKTSSLSSSRLKCLPPTETKTRPKPFG